jgi:hypothetical protein
MGALPGISTRAVNPPPEPLRGSRRAYVDPRAPGSAASRSHT